MVDLGVFLIFIALFGAFCVGVLKMIFLICDRYEFIPPELLIFLVILIGGIVLIVGGSSG